MTLDLLNLPQYHLLRIEQTDHDIHLYAEVKDAPVGCIHCQSPSIIRWNRREQVMKDLPMQGKRVGIYIDTKRYRCQTCGKTFMEPLPAMADGHAMTQRLAQWLCQQSMKRTYTSLADETGVVEGTVRNLFRDYINELEKTVRFETPKWMGIDEIHLIKPRCVVLNIENNTIVNMLADRNKKTVANYLSRLDGRERVQYVAMDMWTPYRDAVEAVLPQATVVIDKFHVVRMANDAIEKVRKSLREDLTPKQRRGLMHDRFVLLKRQRDLTDEEAFNLDGWAKNYPQLGEAYRLKEAFYDIYDAESVQNAQDRYEAWYRSITPEVYDAYGDLVRAWTNWQPWILNYFDHRITNAYTESLNNLIRVLNRLGRGYSFEALRAKILYTEGLHKHTKTRPRFERKREQPKAANDMEMGYGVPPPKERAAKVAEPHAAYGEQQHEGKPLPNYGVDITTLTRMLEAGELE